MKFKINCAIPAWFLLLLVCIIPSGAFAENKLIAPDKIKYPALEFRMPQAERIALDNGMVLFYLKDNELPLVSVSALVRTGSLHDPPGKEGTAELTASVMRTGGTSGISSTEMDQRLDFWPPHRPFPCRWTPPPFILFLKMTWTLVWTCFLRCSESRPLKKKNCKRPCH